MVTGAERAARAAVVSACRRLDDRGLIAGAEGNVSCRFGARMLVITPAGVAKATLRSSDLVLMRIDGTLPKQRRRPSSEAAMHLAIYLARPDVLSVVHAHPPAATGFAVAHRPLPVAALAELAGVVGTVPLVRYEKPGSRALGVAVARGMRRANAALLANHGAVAVGPDCAAATNLMESLEQCARILVTAHILGGVTELGHSDVLALGRSRTEAVIPEVRRAANRGNRRS